MGRNCEGYFHAMLLSCRKNGMPATTPWTTLKKQPDITLELGAWMLTVCFVREYAWVFIQTIHKYKWHQGVALISTLSWLWPVHGQDDSIYIHALMSITISSEQCCTCIRKLCIQYYSSAVIITIPILSQAISYISRILYIENVAG